MLRSLLTNLLGLLFWVILTLMTLVVIGLPFVVIWILLRVRQVCAAARLGMRSITG